MRSALLSLFLALSVLTLGAVAADARTVTVDTAPLAARGVPEYAAIIKAHATPRLRAALARAPGGPITVRVKTILMPNLIGAAGYREPTDYLEAEVVTRDGRVMPLLITVSPTPGGLFSSRATEAQRVRQLAEALVSWVVRYN